ncbi:hypothetical protein ROS1_09160 [Roseibium sp. ROS1]
MKAADANREAGQEKWASKIDSSRKLVALDAGEADEGLTALPLNTGDQLIRSDAGVAFVNCLDDHFHLRPQNLPMFAIPGNSEKTGK